MSLDPIVPAGRNSWTHKRIESALGLNLIDALGVPAEACTDGGVSRHLFVARCLMTEQSGSIAARSRRGDCASFALRFGRPR